MAVYPICGICGIVNTDISRQLSRKRQPTPRLKIEQRARARRAPIFAPRHLLYLRELVPLRMQSRLCITQVIERNRHIHVVRRMFKNPMEQRAKRLGKMRVRGCRDVCLCIGPIGLIPIPGNARMRVLAIGNKADTHMPEHERQQDADKERLVMCDRSTPLSR